MNEISVSDYNCRQQDQHTDHQHHAKKHSTEYLKAPIGFRHFHPSSPLLLFDVRVQPVHNVGHHDGFVHFVQDFVAHSGVAFQGFVLR